MAKLRGFLFILSFFLLFLGCDSKSSQSREDVVKADIKLTTDRTLGSAQKIGWKSFYVQQYKRNGENYTGEQIFHYQDDSGLKAPYLIRTFENGLLIKEAAFRKNGKEIGPTEYEYRDAKVVKVTSYFANGHKESEVIHPSLANDNLGIIKEWHENGQLKFQVRIDDNNEYSGQMTLKDEEGNIVKQAGY